MVYGTRFDYNGENESSGREPLKKKSLQSKRTRNTLHSMREGRRKNLENNKEFIIHKKAVITPIYYVVSS